MRNLDQQDSKPSPCIGAQLHFPNLRESAQICVPPPPPFLNPHDGRSSDEDEYPKIPGVSLFHLVKRRKDEKSHDVSLGYLRAALPTVGGG